MAVKIKRHMGWINSGSKINIKIDGETVDTLSENDCVYVTLPEEASVIEFRLFGMKSRKVKVSENDTIKIQAARLNKFISIFLLGMISLSYIIPEGYRVAVIISIISLLIITNFFLHSFKIDIAHGDSYDEFY